MFFFHTLSSTKEYANNLIKSLLDSTKNGALNASLPGFLVNYKMKLIIDFLKDDSLVNVQLFSSPPEAAIANLLLKMTFALLVFQLPVGFPL